MKVGGVVLRVDERLWFVPADVALRLEPHPKLARVAGASPDLLGIALFEGNIIPVLGIGPSRGPMLVCAHEGERVGLVGGEVMATGLFDRGEAERAWLDGREAAPFDLAAACARLKASGWARRWNG